MPLLIQRTYRKFTFNLPYAWIIVPVFVGIVAITPPLASADQPLCTRQSAGDSGIGGFLEKSPPEPVGDAPFHDRNGSEVRVSDYKGTALVINFWATWCPPCVAEMPSLDRLKGILDGTGIDVLAINEDRDGAAMAGKFYEINGIANLDILIDRKMALLKANEITALPTTLLVDANGNKIAAVIGEAAWDSPDVVALVKACLLPPDVVPEIQRTSGS